MNGIGARLKLARKMAQLSQRALAERAGVSAMSISKYERNRAMPGSDVLLKLADALGVPLEFFLRPTSEVTLQPLYRKRHKLGAKATAAVQAQIQEWLERYTDAEALLPPEEQVQARFRMPEGFPWPVNAVEDAEQAADALREAWRIGEAPIENMIVLLEDHGVKVGLVEGNPHFDACTFRAEDGQPQPVIALRQDLAADRARFSLAHELGHLLLAVAPDVDEEKAANRFAGAFLVPAKVARRELGASRQHIDPYELLALKGKYGLSVAAWVYRAKDLGILSESRAQALWKWLGAQGWRRREPYPLPPEKPQRLERLVWGLLAEGIISEGRAAELLGVTLGAYLQQRENLHVDFPTAAVTAGDRYERDRGLSPRRSVVPSV